MCFAGRLSEFSFACSESRPERLEILGAWACGQRVNSIVTDSASHPVVCELRLTTPSIPSYLSQRPAAKGYDAQVTSS